MNQNKKAYLVFAKWVLFVLLIYWAFKLVDFERILVNLSSISIFYITIFLFFVALSKLFYALRWQQICLKGLNCPNAPLFYLLRLNLLGEFVGITTPSALGGEALRVLKLNTLKIGKIKGTATIVLDRIIGLGSMVIMTAFLLPVIGITFFQSVELLSHKKIFFALFGLFICTILFLLLQKNKFLELYRKIRTQIHLNFSLFITTIAFSIIGHLIFVGGFYILFLEIYPISFLTTAAFILISQITRSIPISFLGIGIGEGTMIGLSGLLAIKAEVIFVIIVLSLGSRYLFAFLGVVLELFHDGRTMVKNLKLQKDKNCVL